MCAFGKIHTNVSSLSRHFALKNLLVVRTEKASKLLNKFELIADLEFVFFT